MYRLLALILCFVSMLALAADGVLYKWKDAEGNIRYGDRPPKGVPYERIRVRGADSGDASAPITEKMEAKKEDNKDIKDQLEQAKKQMAEACRIAKANLKTLDTATRIKTVGEDGKERLMSDAERAEKKKDMEEKRKRYCEEQP